MQEQPAGTQQAEAVNNTVERIDNIRLITNDYYRESACVLFNYK